MPTSNIFIGQEDGWVLVATAPKFVRTSAVPHKHPYYIYAAASLPAATVVGAIICAHPFEVNVTMTENLYARIVSPVPNSQNFDGKLRLDVFTV